MRIAKLIMITCVILASVVVVKAQPPTEIKGGEIVATGFNGPQGVLLDADNNLWVIDSGLGGEDAVEFFNPEAGGVVQTKIGSTARVVMISPDGEQKEIAYLPSIAASEMENLGGGRLAVLNGTLYATTGGWVGGADIQVPALMGSVVRIAEGNVTEVANLWEYEKQNNPDDLILEAHPYGITVGPDGWLWIAGAGSNSLERVNPENGEIETVAVFVGLPGIFPNPTRNNAVEADPVPTAVVFDADGNAYVSLLSGFPFAPGSAKVVKVAKDGTISDYATGLTMLTDLQRGADGRLYAVQFGLFTETGPVPNSGSIVRIGEGNTSELLVDSLPLPTSIALDADGNAFVTLNGLGAPGSGAVVRFDKLTDMDGKPLNQN